ncbi:39S ribosomal protein L42, mitochondrial isoform X2 [Nomascus leucogenys]|uniref:39S ribosomal protein L42, mitochondrial isoform X2 n=1 Tax=Nomascus leucogenys TaxID=61853 RepID=UPI00122DB4A3|nr:39S ribosomal protein L42, mitochondrial isoform X2 [Nomascus leucogenys]XP_055093574.1 39S ribosomal protein L42, mitochondrial isoform X1 [Symphalangus syndactylus]XP_055093575.1 39S ribosomal protein L42, mitochondrial isoform X1 [Symphalangus syndactylus]XP_055093576.1 39S ribosomal protein L42, mitochondrial isoform X1 [Symphalangus syndactylus]
MAVAAVKWVMSKRTILKHLFPVQNGALYCVCHKSTYSPLPDDYNCNVELALTSDGRTIVCYHPSVDIPYEHTKPIPRPDPVHNNEETHDQVLKTRLEEKVEHLEEGPMIEQLSKMFFTTKHRWYPHGRFLLNEAFPDQLIHRIFLYPVLECKIHESRDFYLVLCTTESLGSTHSITDVVRI